MIEPRRRETNAASLSFGQQRLWFLDQLVPENPFYNLPGAYRVRGELDIGALRESLNAVVSRHETLRTTFTEVDGDAVQVIAPSVAVDLPVELLEGSQARSDERGLRISPARRHCGPSI